MITPKWPNKVAHRSRLRGPLACDVMQSKFYFYLAIYLATFPLLNGVDFAKAWMKPQSFSVEESVSKRGNTMILHYDINLESIDSRYVIRYGDAYISVRGEKNVLDENAKKYLMLHDYYVDRYGNFDHPIDSYEAISEYLEPRMVKVFPGGPDALEEFVYTKIGQRWTLWAEVLINLEYENGFNGKVIIRGVEFDVLSSEDEDLIKLICTRIARIDEVSKEMNLRMSENERDIRLKFVIEYRINKNRLLPVIIKEEKFGSKTPGDYILDKSTTYSFDWGQGK